MSPIRDIVNLAVQTYFQHYSTPEQSTLPTTDASLITESSKDLMVEVLENVRSLANEEITKRTTHLKRRRNQEHASIYQLPHEVFAEIILVAGSTSVNISNTRTLMSVSKYWCDTVAQCPHIWSRLDVAARLQPGKMTIIRILRGPVEVQYQRDLADLEGLLVDLATLDPSRFQALIWNGWPRTGPLCSFFRERNSNIVDLAIEGPARFTNTPHRLELSPEGRCLRRVDLRRVSIPWTSPRLSQLQILAVENLLRGEEPSVDDIYRILSSSPALQRIRLRQLQDTGPEDQAPLTIKEPLFLPLLRSV
ncbi:hypothetical protein M407DRAFT_22744 [Tulasnella calospora MUT 4182]|uniref:F-box domain-containing protein n=1 Tax=Tulasnella calospora MUT 4182 TaxID=1051891 RepID=A0A0C3QKP1_9AGAM|nr:hypothetical protein M407DRAFT_22744 [Tulasnella calospora MUT 4182]